MILDAAAILAAQDRPITGPIPVPEWGGDVYMRSWSAAEMEAHQSNKGNAHIREDVLVLTLCDAAGALLFTPDQAQALTEKNNAIIERLTARALEVSGATAAVADAKNDSAPMEAGDSGTSSPSPSADVPLENSSAD